LSLLELGISTQHLMPHGYCLSWNPSLLWSYAVSDAVITLSYFSIPFALWYFAKRRPDIPHRWLILLFGVFITACGVTHLLDVINIWDPAYYPANALMRIVTAVVSFGTALALWRFMPQALSAPSAQQLEEAHGQLEASYAALEQKVQERTRALSDALRQARHLSNALDEIPTYVYMKDRQSRYIYANRQTLALFKCTADELSRMDDYGLFPLETAAQIRNIDDRVLNHGENTAEEVVVLDASGTKRYYWEIKTPIYDEDHPGEIWGICGISTDITDKKRSEELIWEQANFDALTGLPNRRMIQDRLEQEIKKCQRFGSKLAVLFIDLDQFKEVNDTLGHDAGDLLLKEAANRIRQCIRDIDSLGRLGGDEFIVLLGELENINSIGRVTSEILMQLERQFEVGREIAYVSASIGITICPEDGVTVSNLLRNADQAMYAAKRDGRGRFSYYTCSMQESAQHRVQLLNDLHVAIDEQQFEMYYQPIVALSSGQIHKAEALVRWNHPKLGLVTPADFIPLAEETGLIIQLGEWVFSQSIAQAAEWRNRFDPDFQISINKSPVQFKADSVKHLARIQHTLEEYGMSGQNVVIEITEGLLMECRKEVSQQLLDFRDQGIQVALDDFGTGYSSLSYLQEFDIDFIKIDKSFVDKLVPGSSTLALCEAMIAMAHQLHIQVIAEGVETREQRDLLIAAGCDFAQGYLFSRPVNAQSFKNFLSNKRIWTQ
jgi:diguanylate cyclase (GGDEF)-like protein/PAS domain S-box-containing protein